MHNGNPGSFPRQFRDGAVNISCTHWRLAVDSQDVVPAGIRRLLDEQMTFCEVQTNGDGACGLHAGFGAPSGQRELRHPDARGLARSLLGAPLSQLLGAPQSYEPPHSPQESCYRRSSPVGFVLQKRQAECRVVTKGWFVLRGGLGQQQ